MAHHESCQCCPTSVSQTLMEMDFERGIWSAAVDGDVERAAKLLKNGLNPDVIDSSHHTALVCLFVILRIAQLWELPTYYNTSYRV